MLDTHDDDDEEELVELLDDPEPEPGPSTVGVET